jgi:hypothetical protein
MRRMEFLVWPFMLLCLDGCYGPTQTLRGQYAPLPAAAFAAPAPALADDEQVRLAAEQADPVLWAERVFAAGRPDLTPSRLFELHRRGVPLAHVDALHARAMRAREADCAGRVAAARPATCAPGSVAPPDPARSRRGPVFAP